MAYFGAKIFAGITAAALTVSVASYTGGTLVSGIKDDITSLTRTIELANDEAAAKISAANTTITVKNSEIDRLSAEIDRLDAELRSSNLQISEGDSRISQANAQIAQANTDMQDVKTFADTAKNDFAIDSLTARVLDSVAAVQDSKLVFTIVQKLDTASTRTLRLSNPNGVDVVVNVEYTQSPEKNGSITVAAGDVAYLTKKQGGEMVKISYTVPGLAGTQTSIK